LDALVRYGTQPAVSLRELDIDPELTRLLPREVAQRLKVFPVRARGESLQLAMADPGDVLACDEVARLTQKRVQPVRASAIDISWAIDTYCDPDALADLDAPIGPVDGLAEGVDDRLRLMDAPAIIRLVSVLIKEAVERRASDIHLEPQRKGLQVRYRVDGVLEKIMTLQEAMQPAVISRIKIMAGMDIGQSRMPQDGRFTTSVGRRRIDVRAATRPTIFGEKVSLRILDKTALIIQLDQLGLPQHIRDEMDRLLHVSRGMLAVVGPTGSGKTTTLYAALHQLRAKELNIETVEDPVEYQLTGINQGQIKPDIGMGFAEHLRAILRQDPDVILVGEVRDIETADMAFRGALTGHLVLSTVHANDAPATVIRLLELGVERYLISSSLRAILAQRLARRVCTECRMAQPASEVLAETPGLRSLFLRHGVEWVYRGAGCDACRGVGFHGRVGIFEMMRMTPRIKAHVLEEPTEDTVRAIAQEEGMRTLEEDALGKMRDGVIGIDGLLGIYADRMTEFEEEIAPLIGRAAPPAAPAPAPEAEPMPHIAEA
jgi:type IV pilus assembly protein PilB